MSITRPVAGLSGSHHYMLIISGEHLLYCRVMSINEQDLTVGNERADRHLTPSFLGGCMTRDEKIREAGELHLELQEQECERQILQVTADKIVRALGEIVKHHENKDHGDALRHVLQNIPSGDHALHDVFLKLGTVKARIAEIRTKLKI